MVTILFQLIIYDIIRKGKGVFMKIIATDYDGTLNHGGIDEKKKQAISNWRRKGNLFGVVSGRGITSLLDIIDGKEFEYDYLIASNGGVIYDNKNNLLFENHLDGQIAVGLVEDLISWGCPFANIDTDVAIMVQAQEKRNPDEYTLADMPRGFKVFNQVSTWLPTIEETLDVIKKIEDKYSGILTPLQNGCCIDIVPFGVNKSSGIYALLKAFDAEPEDVITVGDNVNDYHMIRDFRSYAMANGVDSIKELADYITESVTDLIEKEI